MKKSRQTSAFTLIEMAIVLIIMGIIVGSSTKIFISMSKNSKNQETQELLKLISEEVRGFAITFRRLPTEKELNDFHMHMKDAWGKPIHYVVSADLINGICKNRHSTLEHHQGDKKIADLSYILISSGANRNMQTAINDLADKIVVKSALRSQIVDYNKAILDRLEPYDDLILSRSLWSVKGVVQCEVGE